MLRKGRFHLKGVAFSHTERFKIKPFCFSLSYNRYTLLCHNLVSIDVYILRTYKWQTSQFVLAVSVVGRNILVQTILG